MFINAEQWVGQELLSSLDSHQAPHLHYWARESRSSSAEVDYMIKGVQAVPVEVKAGEHVLANGRKKSYQLVSLPLYMAGQVRRLIAPNGSLLGK